VLAMEMVLIGASNELGAFESGVTGQLFGPAIAIVIGGVASVIVAVGWWFGFPDLRKTDRFPGFDDTGEPPKGVDSAVLQPEWIESEMPFQE